MSILIVDDDEELLACLGKALEMMGHSAVLMSSAKAACKVISQSHFCLVIADLRMPEMSGVEVLEFARKTDPLTVGIVITAYASVASAYDALRAGAYDYLVKPASVQAVQASVRRALEHYELKRSLLQQASQLEEMRKEFRDTVLRIDEMTHKLKEPLSVVYGYASYLGEQDPPGRDPGEFRKGLAAIQKSADTMKELINTLVQSVWSSSR